MWTLAHMHVISIIAILENVAQRNVPHTETIYSDILHKRGWLRAAALRWGSNRSTVYACNMVTGSI